MTATALALLTQYGAVILFIGTFLSCLALPIPTSLMMLAGGSFAATGDLVLWQTALAALAGAIIGDNTGYLIGRRGRDALAAWLARKPARVAMRRRADAYMQRWGGIGVFLSRWLVSPLGPYVNFGAGMAPLPHLRFAVWAALGEIVWVLIYVGLGYSFASQMTEIAAILGNASGFLVAGLATAVMGRWLWLRSAAPALPDP